MVRCKAGHRWLLASVGWALALVACGMPGIEPSLGAWTRPGETWPTGLILLITALWPLAAAEYWRDSPLEAILRFPLWLSVMSFAISPLLVWLRSRRKGALASVLSFPILLVWMLPLTEHLTDRSSRLREGSYVLCIAFTVVFAAILPCRPVPREARGFDVLPDGS